MTIEVRQPGGDVLIYRTSEDARTLWFLLARRAVDLHIAWIRISKAGQTVSAASPSQLREASGSPCP